MITTQLKKGNVTSDIHDIRLPAQLGSPGQTLSSDGDNIIWKNSDIPTPTVEDLDKVVSVVLEGEEAATILPNSVLSKIYVDCSATIDQIEDLFFNKLGLSYEDSYTVYHEPIQSGVECDTIIRFGGYAEDGFIWYEISIHQEDAAEETLYSKTYTISKNTGTWQESQEGVFMPTDPVLKTVELSVNTTGKGISTVGDKNELINDFVYTAANTAKYGLKKLDKFATEERVEELTSNALASAMGYTDNRINEAILGVISDAYPREV